ncbi:NAD(P)H-binding protein [Streptosporangiaceae bacterium NEAU-GS5]|nr:NAD(P)H-binding protein [Streptosporangiaceae bacterium NEAU-GS5]
MTDNFGTLGEPILVTGGTGTLGRKVVARLAVESAAVGGAGVRVLSRGRGRGSFVGDLTTGDGLRPALDGVTTVVHCATAPRAGDADVVATRNLIAAIGGIGGAGQVRHLVYISIVGVDEHPYSYYRVKREAETLIERSGVPYTILRTTQFHELIAMIAGTLARSPIVLLPTRTSFQPIAASEVAERLVALAAGPPAGRVPDMGGPRVRTCADLMHAYLRGRPRLVASVPYPGRVAAAYRRGLHLTPAHADGKITFEEAL